MKNRRKKYWLPGLIMTVLLLVLEGVLVGILASTRLLPGRILLLISLLCVGSASVVTELTWSVRRSRRFLAGTAVAIVSGLALTVFVVFVTQGARTLEQVTEVNPVELADVCVYVRLEDSAGSIQDAVGYNFGILETLDRENTDAALADINAVVEGSVSVQEFAGIAELVDSLLVTGQTDAIVVNSALLALLEETEGYETAPSQLRELHIAQVETTPSPKPTAAEPSATPARTREPAESAGKNLPEASLPEEPVPEEPEDDHTFSVYISGIDSRTGLIARSRSDVNIVATINTETKQVLLVSTPRDFYVQLPISGGVPDKLTHAGVYGIDMCVGTMELLYQTEIDYYFRVNFSGFERIIDALGGITVYSPSSFTTYNNSHSFSKGYNQMNGSAALAFARERRAFSSGDRQRGKNQMAVIQGVIDKALSPALLAGYSGILQSISGSFEGNMPYELLAELVRQQLDSGSSWNVVTYSANGSGSSKYCYSLGTNAYVMLPDNSTVAHAMELMAQVHRGEILVQE